MYGIIDVIWGANLNAGLKFLIAVTLSLVVYGIIQKMHFEPGAWLLGVRQNELEKFEVRAQKGGA